MAYDSSSSSSDALVNMLLPLAGPKYGTFDHIDTISVATATTITTGTIAIVSAIQFWEHSTTADVLSRHVFGYFESLTLDVIPGPGVFGRAVTLHFGWGHDGATAPTTMAQFTRLHGYKCHTYGGAGDPGEANRKISAPFNEGRTRVLKARYFPLGGKIKFYYFFQEANFGTTQVAGDRFMLDVRGSYSVYGLN